MFNEDKLLVVNIFCFLGENIFKVQSLEFSGDILISFLLSIFEIVSLYLSHEVSSMASGAYETYSNKLVCSSIF